MKTGDKIKVKNANWSFSGDVPKAFDSHVSKSVPLYPNNIQHWGVTIKRMPVKME